MTLSSSPASSPHRQPLGQVEFVAMIALMMALNALAIDTMLPALPDIAGQLGAPHPNDRQLIIAVYFAGMGVGSLIHGPLADRFGRRRVLLVCLGGYILSSLVAALSDSWTMMLVMRATHGLFGAALSVVATALVRDRTSGDRMAQLMSLIFIIFMIVPIIAPTIGQGVLLVASWRWIFLLLAGMGAAMALWIGLRLPETLKREDVLPFSPRAMGSAWKAVAVHRQAQAYLAASALAFGANYGFLMSAQQIISDTFGRADIFPFAFAAVAAGMGAASYTNSRMVMRFGARRVSQTALCAFIFFSIIQWLLAMTGETLALFLVIMTLNLSMTGFMGANFSSIAMQPFGHIAGTAASFQNSARTLLAAAIGAGIGSTFDGTTLPLAQGYVVCGTAALLFVLWGERGKLFTRPNAPRPPAP